MVRTGVFSCENNKRFVQELLSWRTITNEHPEPPITLIHGVESEEVIRFSLLRLKAEEQERIEEQKRQALANGDEVDEDEEQITMTVDESREEASTFQQDMSMIADFTCFDIPQFTMKILQGVPIKALLNIDSHPKKSEEEAQEDLFILDEI